MNEYDRDRSWADEYIPEMCRIIGPWLLKPSEFSVDAAEATDLIILDARDKRIGCRLRRPGYAESYPFDFTIRYTRPSGVVTEFEKLKRGFGDWLFYGHAAEDGFGISRWMIIDLKAWRAHLIDADPRRMQLWMRPKRNFDGTEFLTFDIRSFKPDPPILIGACKNTVRSLR